MNNHHLILGRWLEWRKIRRNTGRLTAIAEIAERPVRLVEEKLSDPVVFSFFCGYNSKRRQEADLKYLICCSGRTRVSGIEMVLELAIIFDDLR